MLEVAESDTDALVGDALLLGDDDTLPLPEALQGLGEHVVEGDTLLPVVVDDE